MATLPVDFLDDILNASMNGKRKYRITHADGSTEEVIIDDVSKYDQVGSNFGAAQVNQTNEAVNKKLESADVVDPMVATEEGFAADAKLTGDALSELNKKIEIKAFECTNLHANLSSFYAKAIVVNNVVIINGSMSLIGDINDAEPVFSINSRLFKNRTFGQTVNSSQTAGALYGAPNTQTVKAWGTIKNAKNYTFLIVGELVAE